MTEPATPTWRDLFVGRHRIAVLVLSMGVLLHSMNALLMSTVMPSAVKDIGGLAYMSWPSTSFLAASVIAASAGGIARAVFGARNAYIVAGTLFGFGSLLGGVAPSIALLVFGRFVQGIGGGLLSSLAFVMVRNVFPADLWPRVFTLFSSIWGISVLLGPLTGGVFAGMGFWRGAFLVVFAMSLILAGLAAMSLPTDDDRPAPPPFPAFRLGLVGIAIAFMSLAAPSTDIAAQAMFILLAMAVFLFTLILDRRAETPVLPSDAFAFRTALGFGLWVLFLITLANDPFPIYGPLFLQTVQMMSPLSAGYLVAMESMSWTLVAAVVATLPARCAPYVMILGPFTMGVGLVGISLFLADGVSWRLLLSICLSGGGIGACFAYLSQTIMASAREGEGDSAASSIATVQLVGLATGAAFAGLIANLAGLSAGLRVDTAIAASHWVPGAFAIFTAIASLFAVFMVRLNKA
jgi:hypothetical protein